MKIVIKGNEKYIKRMFAHLKKEHPSTRKTMSLKNCKNRKGLNIPRGFK